MTPVVQFQRDMVCCKAARVQAGLQCDRGMRLCCAWYYAERIADAKGMPALQGFARHLLDFWPLSDVFWAFRAAGQMSALALVCAARSGTLSGQAREAYRAELIASSAPEFVATFDVLCGAAHQRP